MIRMLECTDVQLLGRLLRREEEPAHDVSAAVAEILENVRRGGDAALLEYERRFDCAELASLEVSGREIDEAYAATDREFLAILELAAGNIRAYHEQQKRGNFWMDAGQGVIMGQKVTPLDKVGVYVPGGTASYISTVLMNVIPAKIAGVGEVIMASPPGKNGEIAGDILAAAKIAGVNRIFRLGGAQAVAALAYGTASVPRVDKIVGPGNIYVATAKRMVFGTVDIDMIAGPSDVLIVADASANAACVAADMLAQAEHDKLAAAVLVTTCKELAARVAGELETQLAELPRKEIAAHATMQNGAIILTDTLARAMEISNHIAPEHLELCVEEPFGLLPLARHAGSIFLGHNAPEALGDYLAGPNHTLPTGGTARFSSALSVDDFVKKSSFLHYERGALMQVAGKIATFARREGLEAHARSALSRFTEDELQQNKEGNQ